MACDWLNLLTSLVPNLEGIGTNKTFWERVDVMGAQAPILATPEDNALKTGKRHARHGTNQTPKLLHFVGPFQFFYFNEPFTTCSKVKLSDLFQSSSDSLM